MVILIDPPDLLCLATLWWEWTGDTYCCRYDGCLAVSWDGCDGDSMRFVPIRPRQIIMYVATAMDDTGIGYGSLDGDGIYQKPVPLSGATMITVSIEGTLRGYDDRTDAVGTMVASNYCSDCRPQIRNGMSNMTSCHVGRRNFIFWCGSFIPSLLRGERLRSYQIGTCCVLCESECERWTTWMWLCYRSIVMTDNTQHNTTQHTQSPLVPILFHLFVHSFSFYSTLFYFNLLYYTVLYCIILSTIYITIIHQVGKSRHHDPAAANPTGS